MIKENEIIYNRISKLYQTNDKMKDFNGYIHISEKGSTLFSQSFGMANYSTMKPSDCDTIFRIGSMTKQFTAMCILILEKLKLLSIDDCLKEYLPDYEKGSHVTIRQLMNMSSGIPEYWNHPEWKEDDNTDNYTVYEFIKDLEPESTAGSKFAYHNSNYILLGILVQKISGMSYPDFLRKNIFDVLNMNRSGYLPVPDNTDNIAVGYRTLKPEPEVSVAAVNHLSYMGASGIYSSAADLCKWDSALYTEKLVSHEKVKEMFTPCLDNYGFGWFSDNKGANHGGDTWGFSTRITKMFSTQHLIIMLCNVDGCRESNMGHYADLVMDIMGFF